MKPVLRRAIAPLLGALLVAPLWAGNAPTRAARGMVVSESRLASQVGVEVLREGGNAVDAAVATAFALAVTHPKAGNIGGGGFLVYRPRQGAAQAFDFREIAPAAAHPTMWLDENGEYDGQRHHSSHLAVGVPGTVAGLHLAWKEQGSLPWKRLVKPSVRLAREGFVVTDELARSLAAVLERMRPYPASLAQFTKGGTPYAAGDLLRQPELAVTLSRVAKRGPAGFYEGETAALIEREMQAGGGSITRDDLSAYRARTRQPIRGSYRGYEILSMPPPSSGGTAIVQMLNLLEGYDMAAGGPGSARSLHRMAEAMRRAFADRARFLGDPEFTPAMPLERLTSKPYAASLRRGIASGRASVSSPESFTWPVEGAETTHLSIVDADRNAVSLTYTLEQSYGSAIVVPGAGFLLNNEMGDFNPAPGLTDAEGKIGTEPNLSEPHKRPLSSMSPTIVSKDGELFMVTGSPGGRAIINTVLQTILNVIDHGMNAQEAVDAGRIHHQWLPDRIQYELRAFSPDTLEILAALGHELQGEERQGVAQVIVVNGEDGMLEGGVDRRVLDGSATGY